jgi:hypothetical protein
VVVGVNVGELVLVDVKVGVEVGVLVDVRVGVNVGELVLVEVDVGVAVGVLVSVNVGVGGLVPEAVKLSSRLLPFTQGVV